MEKNDEKRKKNEKKWIHTQNPRRFPGFTVVVVTFFVKILDDFHDFVSECVSFQRKINNPFWGVIVFPKKSDNFHWTWNKNTHFTDENQRKKIAKVSPTNNNYLKNNITIQQQQQYNLVRLRFNRRGASTPLWGVESCSHPSRRPNPIPAIPPLCHEDTTSPWSTDYGGNS